MTYETKIGIEIAGIRRAVPLEFRYTVETINGEHTLIHKSVLVRCGRRRFPAEWVYQAMGVHQRRGLDDELLSQWAPENGNSLREHGSA